MITKYEKFEHGDLKIEINWNEYVTPCKEVKFTINGQEAIISNSDFYALNMLLATEAQLDALTPLKSKKVRQITKMVKAKTNKDIKKGEYVVFPLAYWVPEEVYDEITKLEGMDKGIGREEAKKKLEN